MVEATDRPWAGWAACGVCWRGSVGGSARGGNQVAAEPLEGSGNLGVPGVEVMAAGGPDQGRHTHRRFGIADELHRGPVVRLAGAAGGQQGGDRRRGQMLYPPQQVVVLPERRVAAVQVAGRPVLQGVEVA